MILSHEFYLKCQDWRLGSFFEIRQFRPLFTLKSGSVTECNLHGRHKKGRGWGWGVVLPYKSNGVARQKISRTPLIGYQNLVLWACLLQIIIFLTRLILIFLFFLVMTMYANEFQTKEKQKLTATYIKITFEHFPLKDFLKVNIVINLYLAAVT